MPAAPAAPPPVETKTTPAAAPESAAPDPREQSALEADYAELDALDKNEPIPDRKPKTDPKETTKGEEKPNPEAKKPEEKPIEKPSSADTKKHASDKETNIAKLKAGWKAENEKAIALEAELQTAKSKLREFESRTPEDTAPIKEKLAKYEKENQQLRDEIRYVNYTKHPEFSDKYVKPYQEAWTKALSEITQLTITTEDGETRKATDKDLLSLAAAPLDQLDELAEKWFGKSAPRVIRHVEKVRDLAEAQDKALEEAHKSSAEWQTKQQETMTAKQKAVAEVWGKTNAELATKYPKWFGPKEGDDAGNALLKKGFEYADTVFNGNGKLTEEQKAQRLAVIRNKSANHDRLVVGLKAANARIAELEASLKQFEDSEPAAGRGGESKKAEKDYLTSSMEELDSLDKKAA